jgi:general secretion pathway protein B
MSFILDALKKSESDRQRQTGPALFEVKIAPPKAGFPLWAIALAVLLAVNMIIVCWLLLRHSSHAEEGTDAAAAAISAPAPLTGGNPIPAAAAIPSVPASPAVAMPSMRESASAAANPTGSTVPSSSGSGPGIAPARENGPGSNREPTLGGPGTDSTRSPGGSSAAGRSGANTEGNAGNNVGNDLGTGDSASKPVNPDDYAPATEAGASPAFKGHVRRGTESGLMLYQDAVLVAGSNLPQLRLDLHVYAAKPQDRFALINMHKLHEGDSLPEGVRIETITPDGVVISHNGSKFLLPRD